MKLLPFDNKAELQVVADLKEGSSVEDTDRALQVVVHRLAEIPEVVSFETYAGTAAPFNFNASSATTICAQLPNRATCRST